MDRSKMRGIYRTRKINNTLIYGVLGSDENAGSVDREDLAFYEYIFSILYTYSILISTKHTLNQVHMHSTQISSSLVIYHKKFPS